MAPKKHFHPESKERNIDDATIKNKLEEAKEELQCNICTELFVKAQTLVCSHTFCKFCIEEWMRKQSLCPLCRTSITACTPTAVIDNIIEKLIESSSDETKEQRRIIIEERNAMPGGSNSTNNNVNVSLVPTPEPVVTPDENNEISDDEYLSNYENNGYQNDDHDNLEYGNNEHDHEEYDNDEYDDGDDNDGDDDGNEDDEEYESNNITNNIELHLQFFSDDDNESSEGDDFYGYSSYDEDFNYPDDNQEYTITYIPIS